MNRDNINTVADAVKLYKDSVFRENQIKIIRAKLNTEKIVHFQNDNYVNALCLTKVLLDSTNFSLRIITGSDFIQFEEILKDSIKNACNRIMRNSGLIRVLVLNKRIDKNLESIKNELEVYGFPLDSIVVRDVRQDSKLDHFVISDGRNLRKENPHDCLTSESPADTIKAEVVFGDERIASLETKFDMLYNDLKI